MSLDVIKGLMLLAYIGFYIWLVRRERTTILYILIAFLNASVLFSLLLIEMGMYVFEQQKFGYENGAFFIYYGYSLVSLLVFHRLSTRDAAFPVLRPVTSGSAVFAPVAVAFALVLAYSIARNPSYTRFDIFAGPYQLLFVRVEYLFQFAFLFALFRSPTLRARLLIYIIYCVLMFIRGSQFGAFMVASLWLFMVSYLFDQKIKLNARWLTVLAVLVAVPFAIKISQTGLMYVAGRVVLEGHVFWGTINVLQETGPNPDFSAFFGNFNDISSGFQQANLDYGFGRLMYEVNPHMAELAVAAGVRFGAGYPAILIYHFGHGSAMVLDVVFTALYFVIMRFMIRCFTQKDVFYGFVVYLMLYNFYADFFVQGEYANFRAKFIIKLVLLFFVVVPVQEVIRHHRAQVRLRAQAA